MKIKRRRIPRDPHHDATQTREPVLPLRQVRPWIMQVDLAAGTWQLAFRHEGDEGRAARQSSPNQDGSGYSGWEREPFLASTIGNGCPVSGAGPIDVSQYGLEVYIIIPSTLTNPSVVESLLCILCTCCSPTIIRRRCYRQAGFSRYMITDTQVVEIAPGYLQGTRWEWA
jgi:hypothetical protein